MVISRTGWSSELGYEIFLRDGSAGDRLWEHLMSVGGPLGLHPGHTSSIRRIEGAMLSYHADADIHTNPYELGLGRLVDLEMEADFIGKQALKKIHAKGVHRKQVGLELHTDPLKGPNTRFWPITDGGVPVGQVTSAIHSPRLSQNIALALVSTDRSAHGTTLSVSAPRGELPATVVPKPFFDPEKRIATAE